MQTVKIYRKNKMLNLTLKANIIEIKEALSRELFPKSSSSWSCLNGTFLLIIECKKNGNECNCFHHVLQLWNYYQHVQQYFKFSQIIQKISWHFSFPSNLTEYWNPLFDRSHNIMNKSVVLDMLVIW